MVRIRLSLSWSLPISLSVSALAGITLFGVPLTAVATSVAETPVAAGSGAAVAPPTTPVANAPAADAGSAAGESGGSGGSGSSGGSDNPHPAGNDKATDAVEDKHDTLWTRATLFGDLGGLRPWLDGYGVSLGLRETSEYFRNVTGGIRHRGAYDGLTTVTLGVDTAKAFGLPGGSFNVSALQIHGSGLSQSTLMALQNVSGVEAKAATRLWELWYQQAWMDGKFSVKVGQQSVDQEFMVSDNAATFANATFGWTALPSLDLRAGGPAYPLSSLGVRVSAALSPSVTALVGVFDANPTRASESSTATTVDGSGTRFNVRDGALVIGELQYRVGGTQDKGAGKDGGKDGGKDAAPAALSGTYRLGGWYDTQRYSDPRADTSGASAVDDAVNGSRHKGNFGFYAVADQTVWQSATTSARSVGVFARVMGAPGDRNLVTFNANAGITLKAPFAGRDADVAGLAISYARIGDQARTAAANASYASYAPGVYANPARTAETVIEATYLYQLTPWWQWQGDLQYMLRPGGGLPDPSRPGKRIADAFVIGIRTTIAF